MKNYVVYNVAKGGLVALTRSLARELGPEVRVNGVAPGTILWPDDEAWKDELARQRIMNQTALKRIGEPDDIAKAVEFLLTRRAVRDGTGARGRRRAQRDAGLMGVSERNDGSANDERR